MKKLSLVSYCCAAIAAATVLFFAACQKSATTLPASALATGKQNVSLYLTDGPGFFDSVFINIKSVSVLLDTCAKDSSNHDYFNRNHDASLRRSCFS